MTTTHPTNRSFPRTCVKCRAKSVVQTTVARTCEIKYDGKLLSVNVPDLPVEQCSACGNVTVGAESEARIDDAVRSHIGLLTPAQIRECRKELDLTQPELAEAIGCATETVCRWETGDTIQSRSYDRFLRAYFHLPQLRELFASDAIRLEAGQRVVWPHNEPSVAIQSAFGRPVNLGRAGRNTIANFSGSLPTTSMVNFAPIAEARPAKSEMEKPPYALAA